MISTHSSDVSVQTGCVKPHCLIMPFLIRPSVSFGPLVPFVPCLSPPPSAPDLTMWSICVRRWFTQSHREIMFPQIINLWFLTIEDVKGIWELENIIQCGAGPPWMRVSIKACQIRCANSSVWIYYYYGPWNAGEYCLHADEGPAAETSDQITLH